MQHDYLWVLYQRMVRLPFAHSSFANSVAFLYRSLVGRLDRRACAWSVSSWLDNVDDIAAADFTKLVMSRNLTTILSGLRTQWQSCLLSLDPLLSPNSTVSMLGNFSWMSENLQNCGSFWKQWSSDEIIKSRTKMDFLPFEQNFVLSTHTSIFSRSKKNNFKIYIFARKFQQKINLRWNAQICNLSF